MKKTIAGTVTWADNRQGSFRVEVVSEKGTREIQCFTQDIAQADDGLVHELHALKTELQEAKTAKSGPRGRKMRDSSPGPTAEMSNSSDEAHAGHDYRDPGIYPDPNILAIPGYGLSAPASRSDCGDILQLPASEISSQMTVQTMKSVEENCFQETELDFQKSDSQNCLNRLKFLIFIFCVQKRLLPSRPMCMTI